MKPDVQPQDLGIGRLFHAVRDAVIVADVATGRIVLWNPAAEALFGYSATEAIGLPVEILVPDRLKARHREGMANFRLTGEGTVMSSGTPLELPSRRKTGEEIFVEMTLSPLDDPATDERFVLSILREVTERRRAENVLRELAQGLSAATGPAFFTSLARYLRSVLAVDHILIGELKEPDHDVVRPVAWVSHGDIVENVEFPLADTPCATVVGQEARWYPRAVQERFPRDRRLAKMGTESYLGIPLFDSSGRSLGVIAAMHGVTIADSTYVESVLRIVAKRVEAELERRQTEAMLERQTTELRRSNEELERFAYVASHDLQEPLRMVASYVQLLERRYRGKLDANADEFIAYAVDGARRMQTLINDLLAYSRVSTRGKDFEPTDCGAIFDKVIANLRVMIAESGATVTRDPMPTVLADPSQVGQLLQNLIGNAIKFRGEESPLVHVAVERQEGHWLFSVRDNGIGIDPQYAERIFVMFQRLHNRGEYAGTGIGLAICKKIVERHGGRIWAEPNPERGTTFLFTLPTEGDR